jgi:hypothetical protein
MAEFRTFEPEPLTAEMPSAQALPEKEEKEINGFLDDLYTEAKRAREGRERDWQENIRVYMGQSSRVRAQGLSQAQYNNTWRIVNLVAALLTDAKPRPDVGTRRPTLDPLGKEMRKIVEAIWFMQDMDRKVARICYDLQIFGKAFMKVIWDPGLAWGEGDISILRVDPRYMFVDNVDDLSKSQYICYRAPLPLWEIRQLFPERGQLVVPDVTATSADYDVDPYKLPQPIRPGATYMTGIQRAWVEEWLVRDPSLTRMGELQYPNGRLITRAGGTKVILQSVAKPEPDLWPGPWVDFNSAPNLDVPDAAWALADVTYSRPLQEMLDNLIRYVEDNAALLTAGIWKAEQRSIDETQLEAKDTFIPRPGRILWHRPGTKVERDAGPPLPSTLIDVIKMIAQAQESVSGLLDASGSKVPRGIQAGSAIEALQASTQAAVRLRSREIEAGLARVGQWTINRVLQHYTKERVLYLLGPGGTYEPIIFDPAKFMAAVEDPSELFKLFTFMITPGSSLAISKERMYAMHMALYSAGAIDQEALLTALEYPDKDNIIRRMAQAKLGAPLAAAKVGPTPKGRGAAVTRKMLEGAMGQTNTGGAPRMPGQ